MMVGYFDFSWKNLAGKGVSAKFLDLFIFETDSPRSKKFWYLVIFFQEDIMKQLGH